MQSFVERAHCVAQWRVRHPTRKGMRTERHCRVAYEVERQGESHYDDDSLREVQLRKFQAQSLSHQAVPRLPRHLWVRWSRRLLGVEVCVVGEDRVDAR